MSSTVSTAYAVAMDFLCKYAPVAAEQFAITNVTETQNALFGDVDLSNLNWLERAWASYYIHMGNAVLATGLMSFVLHEFVYFGRAIPWLIIDAMPYFQTWKLQPNKHVTKEQIWNCTKVVLLTHFTCEAPLIWLFHPICCYFGMATYEVPFSPIWLMAAQIAFFFVFEDMFHYWAHRGLHYGPLYRRIHKVHHEFSAPIGLAAEYAHPLEVMILAQGTISGPFLYCLFGKDLHILTVYVWVTLRLFQAVDAHSGYDFPWSLRHFLPFWAGADHHDYHHLASINCFSASFRWWDYMLGTDAKYHAYKERVAKAKAAEGGRNERKEMEKAEPEALKAERAVLTGKEGALLD